MRYTVLLFVIFLTGCASKTLVSGKFSKNPLAIVQGVTNETQSHISVVRPTGLLVYYYLEEVDFEQDPILITPYVSKNSPVKERTVDRLLLKDLKLGSQYKLTVKGKKNVIVDQRWLKALDTKQVGGKIGLVSCTDDSHPKSTEMWKTYLNQFADVNFLIGDNVYADKIKNMWGKEADENQLWQRYIESFEELYFYHSATLTPTFYLWDDHDYGKNDGDMTYEYRAQAQEVFETFYPRGNIEGFFRKTLGVGSVLNLFGQKFIFIDNRSFRTPKDRAKGQSHWGSEQEKIIFKELAESKRSWLIQGDQFFGGYHEFESFEKERPKSFKRVLDQIKRTKKTKVIFLSGDRHLSEIMKIEEPILGYETYEITSSGLHAAVFPGAFLKNPSPRKIAGKDGALNFTLIELSRGFGSEKLKVKVSSRGEKNWTHYEKVLSF